MIKKINIGNFGVFKDYGWDTTIGNKEGFRKLNIIYGRNYAGKTTLSRILRCIENNTLHLQYTNPDFELHLYNNTTLTQHNLNLPEDYKIRVYNTDFVKDNLSWLQNEDGSIKPFTILGATNIESENKIRVIDEQIGNETDGGLLHNLKIKSDTVRNKRGQLNANRTDLDNKLRNKALEIKNNAALYNYPTYQINLIKRDVASEPSILSDETKFNYLKLIKEETKDIINRLSVNDFGFEQYYLSTTEILERQITPTQPLIDLINNSILQEWVRDGIPKHQNLRETCGFCGGALDENLWAKLDAHFSKESENLRVSLSFLIQEIRKTQLVIETFVILNKDQFYAIFHQIYDETMHEWNLVLKQYLSNYDMLVSLLAEREKNIFQNYDVPEIEDLGGRVQSLLESFNKLIESNNLKAATLQQEQNDARVALRLSEVAKYVNDVDYYDKDIEAILLEEECLDLESDVNKLKNELSDILESKRKLEAETKDESKGAELVNKHLSHFFGHQELKLVAAGEAPNIKFNIERNRINATNLSEGESSLISFCYFIARIEDELKDLTPNNNLIIYIDDPISSLDNNHIFFMYSLIEAIIAKPKNYSQLFISTHNLDFLKYLRKLTSPNKFKFDPVGKDIPGLANFILERKNINKVQLNIAPEYLRNYITEFNYLFDQIYKCSISDEELISHDYHYNFGNNMRKFLEAYLFYKYPTHKLNFERRLSNFFDEDQVSISLINRVINEYSHLGDNFERGLEPVDSASIILISKAVLNRIRIIDLAQYDALIDSINFVTEE